MADRFWVKVAGSGTGTWDASDTTHWGTVTNGAGGASVPGPSDRAIFDANSGTSAHTVTLGYDPEVKDLVFNGALGASQFPGDFQQGTHEIKAHETLKISTSGNFDWLFSLGAKLTLVGTGDNGGAGFTLLLGGPTTGPALPPLTVNGVGGKWTMAGVLLMFTTSECTLAAGYLKTGGFKLGCGSFRVTGTDAKTFEPGASVVQLNTGDWTVEDDARASFTMIGGTSQIKLVSDQAFFYGGDKTYHTVTLTGEQPCNVQGNNTYTGDLEYLPAAGIFNGELVVKGTQTVQGTFRPKGANPASLVIVHGHDLGFAEIIEAAVVDPVNVQFQDIIGWGAAAPFTGTYVGDGQGTENILYDDPRDLYWRGNGGDYSDSAHWSLSSGGAGGQNPPLVQDTAIFDAASFSAPNEVVYLDAYHLARHITFADIDQPVTLQCPPPERAIYGNFTGSPLLTIEKVGPAPYISLRDRSGTATVETMGAEFTIPVHIRAPGCNGYQLLDDFVGVDVEIDAGSFDGAGHRMDLSGALLTGGFIGGGIDNPRYLNWGAAELYLNGTGVILDLDLVDFMDAGELTVHVTDQTGADKSFVGGSLFYGALSLEYEGNLEVAGSNHFGHVSPSASVPVVVEFNIVDDGSTSDAAWPGDLLRWLSGTYGAIWEIANPPFSLDVWVAESPDPMIVGGWVDRVKLNDVTAVDPWLLELDGDVYGGWQGGPSFGVPGFSWVRRIAAGSWTTPALAFNEAFLPTPYSILEGTVTQIGGEWFMVYDHKPADDSRFLWAVAVRKITTDGFGNLVFGNLVEIVSQANGPGMGKLGNQTRATIVDSGDGGLLVVWAKDAGGGLETTNPRKLYGSKSTDGGATWGAAYQVLSYPGKDLVNPFLVLMPDNVTVRCYFYADALVPLYYIESTDGGATWSAPVSKVMPPFVQAVRLIFRWNDDNTILYSLANAEAQTKVGVWIAEP